MCADWTVGAAVPVYNGERFVAAALRSVIAQTYPVIDVVVVDDGSEDASGAIAAGIGPPARVVHQPNRGIGAARSRAASLLSTEFVVFLDSDDLLTPRSVEARLEVVRSRPNVDIVFGQIRSFAQCAGERPLPLDEPRAAPTAGAMLVRRSAYERVGPFRSGLRVAEGLDWLLRAHELGLREATVAEQVQWRRVHGANNSLTQGHAIQEFPRTLKAYLDRTRARRV